MFTSMINKLRAGLCTSDSRPEINNIDLITHVYPKKKFFYSIMKNPAKDHNSCMYVYKKYDVVLCINLTRPDHADIEMKITLTFLQN